MTFISQTIIDLYIHTVKMSILEKKLDSLKSDYLSEELQDEIYETSVEYASAVKRAENSLDDPNDVQLQIDYFQQLGGSA